jgi:hypothetical protein
MVWLKFEVEVPPVHYTMEILETSATSLDKAFGKSVRRQINSQFAAIRWTETKGRGLISS